jgi:hypothetical protein
VKFKRYLPDVTLVCTSSVRINEHIRSMLKCSEEIEFGKMLFVSHEKPADLPTNIEFIEYPKIENIMDFNHLMWEDIGWMIETSHSLFCQDHATILNSNLFKQEWLDLDYLGAIWPVVKNSYVANNGEVVRNGNGGFSLRSTRLMRLPRQMDWELRQEQSYFNEDGNVCCYWRKEMLEQGIKYGTAEDAALFSYETPMLENDWGKMKTFGHHRNFPIWHNNG